MSKLNQQRFEEYSYSLYFKSNSTAINRFKCLERFANALGFDKDSGGFIILHKNHKPGGLENEIETCLILKNAGLGVVLVEEFENEKSVDVQIDGKIFEIKQILSRDNLRKCILRHFQRTYLKTDNLILHIVQPIHENQLKGYIKEAAEMFPSIKRVWLIYRKQLRQLDRKKMLERKYNIQE